MDIDHSHILTVGKYKGLSVAQVKSKHPWYFKWAMDNAPDVLRKFVPKKPVQSQPTNKSVTLNEDGEEIHSNEAAWGKNKALNHPPDELWKSFMAEGKK